MWLYLCESAGCIEITRLRIDSKRDSGIDEIPHGPGIGKFDGCCDRNLSFLSVVGTEDELRTENGFCCGEWRRG